MSSGGPCRVLLSGGLDSSACLVWALEHFGHVDAVGFDYGQHHRRELKAAQAIAELLGVSFRIERIEGLRGGLLNGGRMGPGAIVPGRNVAFVRAALAMAPRPSAIVLGATAEDQAVFDDCRRYRMDAWELALGVKILSPLVTKTKEDVILSLGEHRSRILDLSWSCYQGGSEPCGTCGACVVRAQGIERAELDSTDSRGGRSGS